MSFAAPAMQDRIHGISDQHGNNGLVIISFYRGRPAEWVVTVDTYTTHGASLDEAVGRMERGEFTKDDK